jgi:dynein heavy chain 2
VNSLLSGGEVPGLWGFDELSKEVASLEAAREADAAWRGPPGAAALYAYFLHRVQVGGLGRQLDLGTYVFPI